jgi:hypothetical protein
MASPQHHRASVFPRALTALSVVVFAGLVAFLCAFKVDDLDVWYHLKAGKLMVRTGALIRIDPFAYTREGQPYLATYEWLGQIVLYLIHAAGGSTALILFRTAFVALAFFLLSAINRPALWIALPVALLGAARELPNLTERPHLFDYVLLATFLLVATRILDAGGKPTRRMAILLVGLEILWVNLHGGAALLGVTIFGALLLQVAWDARSLWSNPSALWSEHRLLILISAGLVAAQFVFPSGLSFAYLYYTFTDKTPSFIQEWQPRAWGPYIRDLAPWFFSDSGFCRGRRSVTRRSS